MAQQNNSIEVPTNEPVAPGPATVEALKVAPQAVKRSMPMALSIALGILLAGALGWIFQELIWFILIIYLSFVAATILEAPLEWIMRIIPRRGIAGVIVMVGMLGVVFALLFLLGNGVYNQFSALSNNLEQAPAHINGFINGLKRHFPELGSRLGDFDLVGELSKMLPTISSLWSRAMWGVEIVTWLVIMFFLTLYMLIDGAEHLRALRSLIPRRLRLEATQLFREVARAHRGWAFASVCNVTSSSVMLGTGLYFIGIPGAFLLGFVAGLGELIPNFGPVMGAMPAILVAMLANPDKFLWVLGLFILVDSIQGWTISPHMMKFSVKLPVLVTLMSIITFGLLFGLLGVLVAIPIVADMVVIWQYMNRHMEKDTTEYDVVNLPPGEAPASASARQRGRFKNLFRRSPQQAKA